MIATFETACEAAAAHGRRAVCAPALHEMRDLLSAPARRIDRAPAWPLATAADDRHRGGRQRGTWLDASVWRPDAGDRSSRRPAYSAAAIVTLGFGTGIMTAVFSLVDTVLSSRCRIRTPISSSRSMNRVPSRASGRASWRLDGSRTGSG